MKSFLPLRAWRVLPAQLRLVAHVTAADIVWTNLAGGNWNNPTNWSPNQVPGATDNALITNAGTYTVTLNANADITSLTLGGNSGTQTLTNTAFNLTLSANSVVDTNAVFGLGGGLLGGTGTLLVKGSFVWSAGTMATVGGRTVFTNTATVTHQRHHSRPSSNAPSTTTPPSTGRRGS